VQKNARLMFCDHESSGDSYDQGQDCDQQNHHIGRALSGHVCWLNSQAHQIACETVDTDVGSFGDPNFSSYKGAFGNNGGLFHCHGKEVVENYLIPKTFLQEFSKTKQLSKENWKSKGSDIHGNAQAGDDSTAYYLQQVDFAVVADSWALNEKSGLDKPSGSTDGPVFDRVNNIYTKNPTYALAIPMTEVFLLDAVSKGLLLNVTMDNVKTPRISFPKPNDPVVQTPQAGGQQGYYSSPWRDAAYRNTNSNRGDYYMGCTSPEGC
jgi:hypothetical protein